MCGRGFTLVALVGESLAGTLITTEAVQVLGGYGFTGDFLDSG
jgi:hypothetical protein